MSWGRGSPELLISLVAGVPLGRQVQDTLRAAIRDGRLAVGERLPASRALAEQLGVSRVVVVDAYAQLESEGYLRSAQGAGTVVAGGVGEGAPSVRVRTSRRFDANFEYGVPDLREFPMRDWVWALGVAARSAGLVDLGDERGNGAAPLREVLAAYMRRVRSAVADAEAVIVCAGFRSGLDLVPRSLIARGIDAVDLEDPGPVGHDEIARRCGLRVEYIPVDEDGVDVASLGTRGVRAVVVTPAHQAPTGVVLAPHRRLELIDWAHRDDGYVIEDDYDAEFRYDRQPVGAGQGLAPERVIAMGSTSKTLAPTLRLGWLVCPPGLAEPLSVEKQLLGRGAPGLDQLALAALIESGRYDRHLRRMRGIYSGVGRSWSTHWPSTRRAWRSPGWPRDATR